MPGAIKVLPSDGKDWPLEPDGTKNNDHMGGNALRFPLAGAQMKSSAVLDDAEGLIESLEKLIPNKRDMKNAAMQQLFTGKKRLPGFEGKWAEKYGSGFIFKGQNWMARACHC